MLRTFRYPLHPTIAQESTIDSWRVICQQLYNAALQHRRDAWEHEKRQRQLAEDRNEERGRTKSVTYATQTVELTAIRRGDALLDAMPLEAQRSALRRIDRAFVAFFRRCRSGETPGYPRFRSRDRYDSFDIGRVVPHDDEARGSRSAHVRIPKLGLVKFHEYRPLRGRVLNTTVRRVAGRWYICFQCDLGAAPAKKPVASAVGVDVGLTSFATLSDGTAVENPRYFRRAEDQLAMRQQRLSRRQRGSASRRRAKLLVAKAHERIKNQRLDFARKLVCALFTKYDLVAYEDLNIRGMVRAMDGHLSKSINDAAWGVFVHALACKAESAGKWAVAVDPRGTTQRCSQCGVHVPKDLSVRVHVCGGCGLVLGRDENASRNILALGRSVVSGLAHAS